MPKIQVLSPAIADKIAAGEVVERPSSVVKELVENSLDAGSSRVEVEIEEGGKNLIRVTDNGTGVEIEDLPLLFASHATSKLSRPEDLFSIGSLGFRGEALASIGSISQARVTSRYKGHDTGAEIECHGGKIGEAKLHGASQGTMVEMRNLFYNVPVRRKFLKSTASETASITDCVTKMALAYPGVHFRLTSNGKEIFDCPPSDRLERIAEFYGRELVDSLIDLESGSPELNIEGYAGLPAVNRANRSWQFLFLNGRSIQDRSINHAMNEAYRGLMPERRFPIIFLFLEMDPSEVDVNAHPTKIEVRFRSEWSLYGRVLNAIRQKLLSDETVAPLKVDPQQGLFGAVSSSAPQPADPAPATARPARGERRASPGGEAEEKSHPTETESHPAAGEPARPMAPASTGPIGTERAGRGPARDANPFRGDEEAQAVPPAQRGDGALPEAERAAGPRREAPAPPQPEEPQRREPGAGIPYIEGEPRFLQIHDCYILLETPEGFIVVDQHALHERVLYCEILEKVRLGKMESQHLLIPEPVELSPREMAIIQEVIPTLRELGFEIEAFGKHSVVVQSVPVFLKSASADRVLHDVLSELAEGGAVQALDRIRERILATMACKAAVKFGDKLTPDEVASLLRRSADVPEAIACPHGRPTRLSVNLDDLEKQFGR